MKRTCFCAVKMYVSPYRPAWMTATDDNRGSKVGQSRERDEAVCHGNGHLRKGDRDPEPLGARAVSQSSKKIVRRFTTRSMRARNARCSPRSVIASPRGPIARSIGSSWHVINAMNDAIAEQVR